MTSWICLYHGEGTCQAENSDGESPISAPEPAADMRPMLGSIDVDHATALGDVSLAVGTESGTESLLRRSAVENLPAAWL